VPGKPGEPMRITGWRADCDSEVAAVVMLAAITRLAQRTDASSVRFQPWESPSGNGTLTRACRVLGFVPRADLTTLWVRTHDASLARVDAVVSSPLLALGF
jgi:hypothetical protein